MLLHGSSGLWFPVSGLWKHTAKIHPLSLTQLSDRLSHGHQICRILTAIHKHDLLVIPVSSRLCVFVSCSLWCARSSVYVWETAAKGPLISVFHSPFPLLTACQRVSCYSAWTQQCSKQRSRSAQPWHFCGISAAPPGCKIWWSAVRKLVSAISSAPERQRAPASIKRRPVRCVVVILTCVSERRASRVCVSVCVFHWEFVKTPRLKRNTDGTCPTFQFSCHPTFSPF